MALNQDNHSAEKYFFIAPVLKHIGEGRLFSRVFATFIRVLAVLTALGGLISWFRLWRVVFHVESGMFGGMVYQLILLVGIYMVTHVLWLRASDMANQPASDFTVIPIVAILLRMVGEVYACLLLILGLCGGILIVASEQDAYGSHVYWMPSRLFGALVGLFPGGMISYAFGEHLLESTNSVFLAAILFLIVCVVLSFVVLVVCYLLAECIVVLVDIARNIRVMRKYYDPAVE